MPSWVSVAFGVMTGLTSIVAVLFFSFRLRTGLGGDARGSPDQPETGVSRKPLDRTPGPTRETESARHAKVTTAWS
jgi:hypothetical protein